MVTDELLTENNFQPKSIGRFTFYKKYIKNSGCITLEKSLTEQITNTGREWLVLIEDEDFCTIGSVEVDTIKQLKSACEIYDIDFNKVIAE